MKSVRVGVVGVGYLGKIHAKIYAALPGVELVGIHDIDTEACNHIAEQYDCEAFKSVDSFFGQVDAVSIVVPTSLHLDVTLPFLKNGVHVMLEKPIAPTVAESEEIVRFAEDVGCILQIGHLERFNAGVMKLAELSANPRFIEVHRLGKFVERATDVDVVTDLMIHDIDIVMSLVPSDLVRVSANGTRVVTDHVDIANARLEFENGAVANVTASRVSRSQFRRIRVFAEKHYLGLNFADQSLEEVTTEQPAAGEKFPSLKQRIVDLTPQQPLDAELAHFADCVRNRRSPLVSGEDGLRAVEVATQVRQEIANSMSKG
ncbi:MAG: Gfo/Idh/MocA family oxidoreductase [Pseudomonadota bacterium]